MVISSLEMLMFDLDGTLIESLDAKDAAFAALYANEEMIDEIFDYHKRHNHVVRFEKFRHISENILGRPLSLAEDNGLRERFAGLVVEKLISCPEVPGARRLIETYRKRIPVILISHSPDAELRHVLAARGLDELFDDVYSADWKKQDAIRHALQKWGRSPSNSVYVGDSPEDAAAAVETNVAFIGRRSNRDLGGIEAPVFDDMYGVSEYLASACIADTGTEPRGQ